MLIVLDRLDLDKVVETLPGENLHLDQLSVLQLNMITRLTPTSKELDQTNLLAKQRLHLLLTENHLLVEAVVRAKHESFAVGLLDHDSSVPTLVLCQEENQISNLDIN